MFAYKKIFVLLLFAFLASCVTTYDVIEQGETLILTDQTRIPCRILDFDGVDVYFKARRGADAYRYGEFITIGNLEAIHVTKGGQTLSYSPLEYLDEKFPVENVETPGAENAPSEEEYPQAAPEDSTVEETEQPELTINTEGFMSDSLSRARASQGIGLNLVERLKPEKSETPEAYEELADLIIESGGTGLMLYRVEQNEEHGVHLTDAQQMLIDAIQNSDSWDERKKSMRSAHKFASEAFVSVKDDELQRVFHFRAQEDRDAFIQFLIFLHKQGDLYDRAQYDKVAELFNPQVAQALSDILINFEDWYYIVVVKSGY